MNFTVPDYILKAIMEDGQNLEKGKSLEKIYTSNKGHRILVYTYWNGDYVCFNMEWECKE